MDNPAEVYSKYLDTTLPRAPRKLDGLDVGTEIHNVESIRATLEEYDELRGVRVVQLDAFGAKSVAQLFYSVSDHRRCERLAELIAHNERIDPLIVAFDAEGPYIIEGAHRLGALMLLRKAALPALVVVDTSAAAWRGRSEE
jgi:hypothetical protein